MISEDSRIRENQSVRSSFDLNQKLDEMILGKLDELKEIKASIERRQETEIMKLRDEYLEEKIENSKMKTEILRAEAELIDLSLSFKKKSDVLIKSESVLNLKEDFNGSLNGQSLSHSSSLKSIDCSLNCLKMKLTKLSRKVHKSGLEIQSRKFSYKSKIDDLKSQLTSANIKIDQNISTMHSLSNSLSSQLHQNKSISLSINPLKATLNKLQSIRESLYQSHLHLSQQVFRR